MAGNHRRPCNVPSHPFSFGVPKEVTDVLAVGLESQESDCTRAPRTRDPIIGYVEWRRTQRRGRSVVVVMVKGNVGTVCV